MAEVSEIAYWRNAFDAICNPKQLVEYIVMDIEVERNPRTFPGQGQVSQKHVTADVWLVKASELGINESTIHTKTHLGHILKPGDSVMGFDLRDANINNAEFELLKPEQIPDILLIKKHYADRMDRKKNRNWKLKHIVEDVMDTDIEK